MANWYMNPRPPAPIAPGDLVGVHRRGDRAEADADTSHDAEMLKVIMSLGIAVRSDPIANRRQAAMSVLRSPNAIAEPAPNSAHDAPNTALAVVNPNSASEKMKLLLQKTFAPP